MYENAPRNEQVAHIHLFGIKYAQYLQRLTNAEVIRASGIPATYHSELAKGRKLSKYVVVKE